MTALGYAKTVLNSCWVALLPGLAAGATALDRRLGRTMGPGGTGAAAGQAVLAQPDGWEAPAGQPPCPARARTSTQGPPQPRASP